MPHCDDERFHRTPQFASALFIKLRSRNPCPCAICSGALQQSGFRSKWAMYKDWSAGAELNVGREPSLPCIDSVVWSIQPKRALSSSSSPLFPPSSYIHIATFRLLILFWTVTSEDGNSGAKTLIHFSSVPRFRSYKLIIWPHIMTHSYFSVDLGR